MNNKQKGFSLLESIIAIFLLSLIALLCSFALKNGILTYNKVENQAQYFETKILNYYRLFLQLKNIKRYNRSIFFKGYPHQLEFITSISITEPGIPGLFKVQYKFEEHTLKIKEIRLLDRSYLHKFWGDIKSYNFITNINNVFFQYYTGSQWLSRWNRCYFPKAVWIKWQDAGNEFNLIIPILLGEKIEK